MSKKIKYEIQRMYTNSTFNGYWHIDKEASTPISEIDEDKAQRFINTMLTDEVTHYETSKAHFYESQRDSSHMTVYIFYK